MRMSTEMGPIESGLRFGVIIVIAIAITFSFSWWIMSLNGPIWPIAAIVVLAGVMIVVSYERLFGWS